MNQQWLHESELTMEHWFLQQCALNSYEYICNNIWIYVEKIIRQIF